MVLCCVFFIYVVVVALMGDIDRPVVVVAVFVVVGFALLIIQTKLMRVYD